MALLLGFSSTLAPKHGPFLRLAAASSTAPLRASEWLRGSSESCWQRAHPLPHGLRGLPLQTRLAGAPRHNPVHCRTVCRAAAASGGVEAKATASEIKVPIDSFDGPEAEVYAAVRSWVVFSDLHLSAKTEAICLEVLRRVREEAEKRESSGVLFLGDWWHHRGSLPVRPLNAVLDELAHWKHPALLLVGNHDQVNLGGEEHALKILEEANRHIRIIDRPTMVEGALFLPYRRDPEAIAAAVRSAPPETAAIFAHIDVVGASMNETFQAKEGLDAGMFPPGTLVLTGHYHKPHTVPGTSIRYIGSPYQVSRSEAGQQKHLLVLDRSYNIVEEIPVSIGPRFLTIDEDLSRDEILSCDAHELAQTLQPGDRVRWVVPAKLRKAERKKVETKLAQAGAILEVVVEAEAAAPRLAEDATLGPRGIFEGFAAAKELPADITEAGVAVLNGVLAREGMEQGATPADVALSAVTLSGFGSFRDATTYSLSERGVRMIVGKNEADGGMDSNGTGKTTLVMAAIWALTGSYGARCESDSGKSLTKVEIVNVDSKDARVELVGTVNGSAFRIERSIKSRGSGTLTFELDGTDLTEQEQKLTQQRIDDVMQTELLTKAVFHNHITMTAFLEAKHKDFAAEVGRLINLNIWQGALDSARAKGRGATTTLNKLEGRQEELEAMAAEARLTVEELAVESERWRSAHEANVQRLEGDLLERNSGVLSRVEHGAKKASELRGIVQNLMGWEPELPGPLPDPPARPVFKPMDSPPPMSVFPTESDETGSAEDKARLAGLEEQLQDTQGRAHEAATGVTRAHVRLESIESERKRLEDLAAAAAAAPSGLHACEHCGSEVPAEHFASRVAELEPELEARRVEAAAAEAVEVGATEDLDQVNSSIRALNAAMDQKKAELAARQREALEAAEAEARERSIVEEAHRRAWEDKVVAYEQEAAEHAEMAAEADQWVEDQREWAAEYMQKCEESHDSFTEILNGVQNQYYLWAEEDKHCSGDKRNPCQLLLEALEPLARTASSDAPAAGAESSSRVPSTEDFDRAWAAADALSECASDLQDAGAAAARARAALMEAERDVDPGEARAKEVQAQLARTEARISETCAARTEAEAIAERSKALTEAFGRHGVQNWVVEGVTSGLAQGAARLLGVLAPRLGLEIKTFDPEKATTRGQEKMQVALTYNDSDGTPRRRTVAMLSQGEKRRVGLALSLAMSELIGMRAGVRCNVLILDEVLGQVDEDGIAAISTLLRGLPHETVLVVGQNNSTVQRHFHDIDVVQKRDGSSNLVQ